MAKFAGAKGTRRGVGHDRVDREQNKANQKGFPSRLAVSGLQKDRGREENSGSPHRQSKIVERLHRLSHAPHSEHPKPAEDHDEYQQHIRNTSKMLLQKSGEHQAAAERHDGKGERKVDEGNAAKADGEEDERDSNDQAGHFEAYQAAFG